MELYQAVILGILQGLTEFLPVSSSGHLVLGQLFFGITEPVLAFDISVHMGTLGAVLVVYFTDIKEILMALAARAGRMAKGRPAPAETGGSLNLAAMIVIGSVPTALIGFFLKQFEDILFTSGLLVGCMLIFTGVILWVSRKFYRDAADAAGLNTGRALAIGVSQGLAVIPGISRSGTTIACGMAAGLDRQTAAKFSFLLSIPAILGAEAVSVASSLKQGLHIDPATICGTIVSFITGLIALKILLKLVHRGKFHLFAPYCWLAGAVVLAAQIL